MRNLLLLAAAGFAIAAPAHAVVFTIDNFSTRQGPVSDFTNNGVAVAAPQVTYSIGGHSYDRDLSINLTAFSSPINDSAAITGGVLDVVNGSGEVTIVEVAYDIPASLGAAVSALTNVTSMAIFFTLVDIDLSFVDFTAELHGNDLGPVIPVISTPGVYRFTVPVGPVNGPFKLTITGDAGYDVTVDDLKLFVGRNGEDFNVSQPAMVALFGLGILALGAARRRFI